jgi:protein disulfide-isomerase
MQTRAITANVLAVVLFATAVLGFMTIERDRAASRPAPEAAVTRYRVDYALRKAKARRHFLMIEFGADWCEDCRALALDLQSAAAGDYFHDHFEFLNIDIGHSDRNFEAADALGVDLSHGIPAVVVFAPDGTRIGATNHGELEPSRTYNPQQILGFLQAVVERRTIIDPAI